MAHSGIRWKHYNQQPPHITWGVGGEVEEWKEFAELARRLVGIIPSESEVERTISTQRFIMGMKGAVWTARADRSDANPQDQQAISGLSERVINPNSL
jgi:hypothetical protein